MSDECEWGTCDNQATHRAHFTTPAETVNYCEHCLPEVRQQVEYERITRL
jgi:predicted sulfurtransferase